MPVASCLLTLKAMFYMRKCLLSIAVAFISSSCISHPAQYQPLLVTLKDNEPCFSITPGLVFDTSLSSHAPTVMKREGGEWRTISEPATYSPVVRLDAHDCHQWNGIDWEAGEYDVALKVTDGNEAVRYAAHFNLRKNAKGELSIFRIE
ncbi:hypothetical protein [Pseudescherichia sp.]|jgi:hypothetical protein|uniref:hypothetical protein n=1 Tax=Pseudescherichia sp. TaxID=2055881 RepID=UPI0028A15E86|nr:hypothetical protein [Pseudescherichia sp.]